MSILTSVLGALTGPIATYLTRRAELKAQKHQNDLAFEQAKGERQAQLIKDGLAADASWEAEFARQAASSWKDEWVLIVLSIPLVGVFIPFLALYMLTGFDILAKTPEWYRWLVIMIFCATYGIRIWRRSQSDSE